ncbi:putative protease Do-like 14 isoform X3 [Tripterygium wilfordii]|uniref:putative protease Do-like 14 isoform X3 n=1 Tax=Tripterygium wilfordii TaxID=458696 RepID=UPI0018F83362|nr:putative protease Do-like 14 isoform X3 [Tripterygium wilfordii]
MNQLLRDASSSSARNSLIRIVSVAALGSHLLYANHYSYSRDRPSFYSRVTPAPSKDLRKEAPGGKGDSAKKYVGYIGRDTFADTVARVFCGITTGKSIGSGIIIDASGTILTCTHVVVDFPLAGMRTISKGKIEIALQDGRTFEGTVVNVDLLSDIATVKINSCKLGSSSKLRPGDWVLAMGCPPSLKNTVTAGVVSDWTIRFCITLVKLNVAVLIVKVVIWAILVSGDNKENTYRLIVHSIRAILEGLLLTSKEKVLE